jgi:redox-sensitive bicupin YhaK (pirin superfamily)
MKFDRVIDTPPAEPGFIGEGHTAVQVLDSTALRQSDPFVLLMDDRLDIAKRRAIGGAHPHAGLETVTLVLEGTVWDRDEGALSEGDVLWMTAGRGIIHNEHVEAEGRSRILQLWIRLSKAERRAEPDFSLVRNPGGPVRRYAAGKHVPVTITDVTLKPNATHEEPLPRTYNGFVYVLEGSLAGVKKGQVGWFDGPATLTAEAQGARFVLYAGEPQREPLIHYGPFVADDERVLTQMFHDYRAGLFTRMSELSGGRHVRRDAVVAAQ